MAIKPNVTLLKLFMVMKRKEVVNVIEGIREYVKCTKKVDNGKDVKICLRKAFPNLFRGNKAKSESTSIIMLAWNACPIHRATNI